jgi:hypothetical protein
MASIVTEQQRIDNRNKAKNLLRIYDSIHDFWKKRGTQSASEDEEGLSDNLLDLIRNDLNEKIFDLRRTQRNLSPAELRPGSHVSPINLQLKTLSSDNSITNVGSATSSFEVTVQDYFETHPIYKNYFLTETKLRVSYQEIILMSNRVLPTNTIPDGWNKYVNNIESQQVLEIYNDATENSQISFNEILYNEEYKNIVNTFILCYMNGKWDSKYIQQDPQAFFTFDAAGKYVKKLFKDDPRMYNLITPQNIADSATTSFNQLKDRIHFDFPVNDDTSGSFNVTSDAFNKNNDSLIELNFINKSFSEQNRYGFNIQINTGSTENIDFNEKEKEGPSVNYLGSLINMISEIHEEELKPSDISSLVVKKKSSVVNILDPLKNLLSKSDISIRNMLLHYLHDSGIFYDLKRMGDHEQCEAAKLFSSKSGALTVLVTLDRLCSLYSRLVEQPCIFHNNEILTLYRFPVIIDETARMNAEYYFKIKEIIEVLNSVSWIDSLKTQLMSIRNKLNEPLEFMINRGNLDNVIISYLVKAREVPESITSKNIINILVTIKIISIIKNINYFLSIIDNVQKFVNPIVTSSNNQTLLVKIKKLINNYNSISSGEFASELQSVKVEIDTNISQINTMKQNQLVQIEKVKQLFNLSFDNNGNVLPLLNNDEIIISKNEDGTYSVPKSGSNTYLELYYGAYRSSFDSLLKVFRLINNNKMLDRLTRNKQTLYEAIVKTEYFDNIRKITNIEFATSENNYIEKINDTLFVLKSDSNEKIITNFNNIMTKLLQIKNELLKSIMPKQKSIVSLSPSTIDRSKQLKQGLSVEAGRKRRAQNSIDTAATKRDTLRRSPRISALQTGGNTNKILQNIDFGEAIFEIMSRCSEFYYSILSSDASNNLETFMNILVTQDKYKTSINELYEECSIHIQNRFFDIVNYNIENEDPYTYQYDPILDYITYLFLYDASNQEISGAAASGAGVVPQSTTVTENTGETLYGDNILTRINNLPRRLAKRIVTDDSNGIDKLFLDPYFTKINELIEKSNLNTLPLLVKFFITFVFAILYDLSYESLKSKSRFLNIMFAKGFGEDQISRLVNDYTDQPSINLLMNRIYIFIQTIFNIYNEPGKPVPQEIKNLLRGGQKKQKRKMKSKKTKKIRRNKSNKLNKRNNKGTRKKKRN